jgi:Lhr-like helicase
MKNQKKKLSKEEKEMISLMKKLRKNLPKLPENTETYRDFNAEKDYDIRNIEADRLFREMKRRDF